MNEKILPQYEVSAFTAKKQKNEKSHKQWKEKHLHGKFIRETERFRSEKTWGRITKGYLKEETIYAAQ